MGQTFTSNSNGDWTTNPATRWVGTNPSACATQYPSPPLTNPSNISCAIDVIINHSLTKTGNNQFAQRFRSLRINSTGYLNFTGNTTIEFTNNAYGAVEIIIDGGTLELYDLNIVNGAKIQVINGGKLIVRNNLTTSGGSSQITVDALSSISVVNDVTIAAGHFLNINGIFNAKNLILNSATTNITTNANVTISNDLNLNSSGSLNLIGNADLNIGRDFNSSGSAFFTSIGNSTLGIGRDFTQSSSGTFSFNNTNTSIGRNFSNTGSATTTFSNDAILDVYGNFSTSNGSINFANSTKVNIDGNVLQSGGGIHALDNSDIRVNGNVNSTGGSYSGSSNSFLGVNGNHAVVNYTATYNLSNNAQVQVNGTTTSPWDSLNVIENACYKSSNKQAGTACVLCGETYTSDGTFYVPAEVYQITIEVWGGGAAGGSGSIKTGGGGGGGYSRRVMSVTPGQPLAVYVGKGGIANDPIASNRDGKLSYVSINSSEALPDRITNSLIFANGGKSPSPITSEGAGGLSLSAAELSSRPISLSFRGGNGRSASSNNGGGGGSAAANNGPGNIGQDPNGGAQPIGKGGPGGQGGYNGNAGNPPALGTYGGGGGGAAGNGSLLKGGNGAGGLVVISFTCPIVKPCARVVDFGTNGDYYVVEYFCDGTWEAPQGLKEFGITAIGGGGGGGSGNAAGGGGAGEIYSTPNSGIYTSINNNKGTEIGFPAGIPFIINIGAGGAGGNCVSRGINGENTVVSGDFNDYSGSLVNYTIIALGGGGGGTSATSLRSGNDGGSGGGGAFSGSTNSLGGSPNGQNTKPGGRSSTNHGGGGGGSSSSGVSPAANATSGGNGGNGATIPADIINLNRPLLNGTYAAGGGGTMSGSTKNPGLGGSGGGGKGNLNGNGDNGRLNTGSGGGAGSTGGGSGGSGKVFIYYPVYRILPVEFLYFNATYLKENNSATLTWSTAKEWENSHFEIQRAVNTIDTWETVGRVEGNGYSDGPIEYSFIDSDLPVTGGSIFYRLKQVDFSDTYSYSATRAIRTEGIVGASTTWIAYPNPSANSSDVKIALVNAELYQDEIIHVTLSNLLGQAQYRNVSSTQEVSAIVSEWLRNSRSGIYLVNISWGNQSQQLKLLRN